MKRPAISRMSSRRIKPRRTSKKAFSEALDPACLYPSPMDEIVVAWMYKGQERWYEVLVLEIDPQNTRPVVAKGVVEYNESADHTGEVQTVEFLISNKGERLIRQIGVDAEEFDTSSWRFVSEHCNDAVPSDTDHDAQSRSSSDKDPPQQNERNSSKDCPEVTNNDEQLAMCDLECIEGYSSQQRLGTDSIFMEQQPLPVTNAAGSGDKHVSNECNTKIEDLRKELFALKRLLTDRTNSDHIALIWSLRHKLLHSLSSRWPFSSRIWSTQTENLYGSQAKIVVNCTLRTMTALARFQKDAFGVQHCILRPSFEIINHLSLATSKIDLYLPHHSSLCELLLMHEERDVRHLLHQTNISGVGKVVQIIGSAGMKKVRNDEVSNNEVVYNRLVVGSSVCSYTDARNGMRFQAPPKFVIEQAQTHWDDGLQCHASKWVRVDDEVLAKEESPYLLAEDEQNLDVSTTIRLSWEPARPVSARHWTQDARNTHNDVVGTVTLYVPIVACTGPYNSEEIDAVLKSIILPS